MEDIKETDKEVDFISFLAGKWMYSIVVGIIIFTVNYTLSEQFLDQGTFYISLLGRCLPVAVDENSIVFFKSIYFISSCIGSVLLGYTWYMGMFERIMRFFLIKNQSAEVESVMSEFPYEHHKPQLIVGLKHNKFNLEAIKYPEFLIIPEVAMYQNFLITGTIGTGKTASVMYPFLKQVMFYESYNADKKPGMLILDVKGNFYKKALEFAKECGREEDLVLIQLNGENTYNPLHKPHMEPVDLASRSRKVIDLFSGGGKKEKFWDTKAAQMMTECIRLLRLTTGYVTLSDIHVLINNDDFLIERLENMCEHKDFLPEFEVNACLNYFNGEFASKAENTIATIKSCVTEMTGFFATSESINRSFCPSKDKLTFNGFEECINEGKIIVLAMNIAEYPEVSKTIAAYLKLDFQSEVQQRTSNPKLNSDRMVLFICDEYQEFVTANDSGFYGLSRESKCCSIVSSQSYTSILQTLGNKEAFDTLQQNLINKIWLRTDDKLTIETAQFLTGKEEKERYSKNISETANNAKKSNIFGRLTANKSSLSEAINVSTQRDYVFEEKVFTQTLKLFKAVCFTANEDGMNEPYLVHLLPYFKEPMSVLKPLPSQTSKTIVAESEDKAKYIIKMKT